MCISSFYFHKEETLDGLHDFIAADAIDLFHNGVEESRLIIYMTYISFFSN